MSSRVYTTTHTVPAGTPISAPLVQAVVLDDITLDSVQILIPAGHSNLTGIAVTSNAAPVVPFNPGTYLSGNNESPTFPYGAEVGANQLQVSMFNNDIYPHTFWLRWQMSQQATSTVVIESPQASTTPAAADVLDIANLVSA